MLIDQAKYLLILYGGITLLNFGISFWFWRKSRISMYSSLVQMWIGLTMVLFLGGLTSHDPFLFVFVAIIPGCYVAGMGAAQVLLLFIGKKPNYRLLRPVPVVALAVTYLLYRAGLPFVIYAIPAAVVNAYALVYGLIRLTREKTEKLTPAKMGFAMACFAMVLHAFDLPFLGNRPETIIAGLTIGIGIVSGLAIFGPLVIVELAKDESVQLKAERGAIERELKEAELMLNLVADTASLLPLSLDLKGVMNQTTQMGVTHIGGIATLHMLDENSDAIHLAEFVHAEGLANAKEVQEFKARCLIPSSTPAFVRRVIRESRPELGLMTPQESAYLSSYVSVPLFDRTKVCGALTIYSPNRPLTNRDLRLATELASRASFVIQSARLFEEAKQGVRLRDDFLAVASHELKTPLTSLNIQVETLRRLVEKERLDTFPQDQLKRMLRMSADQLKSLSKLIDGLLDVSRMAAQGVVLGAKEDVELGLLVREVVERFDPQIQAARCELELSLESSVIGRWDRLRIDQIVTNLLTNAMKYGAGKPIRIEVKKLANSACLVVQDLGIGVSAEDHERIFGRFERAVPVQRFGGLGLGLYIAREIARTHGGSIRVESEPGIQTRFIVELPLDMSSLATPA